MRKRATERESDAPHRPLMQNDGKIYFIFWMNNFYMLPHYSSNSQSMRDCCCTYNAHENQFIFFFFFSDC